MRNIFDRLRRFALQTENLKQFVKDEISFYPTYGLIKACELKLIPFYSNNKIGFLNLDLDLVLNPIYEQIEDEFVNENSLVRVKIDNKWGLIDLHGEYVLKPIYKRISEQIANVYVINANYKDAVCDLEGNLIVGFGEYDLIYPPFDDKGLARVKKNGKWGIINSKGHLVLPIEYDKIWNFQKKFRDDTIIEKDGIKQNILLNDLLKKEIINIEDDEDDYGYRSNYYENDYKSASDNEYYNDNLDFDQQDQEFWENF